VARLINAPFRRQRRGREAVATPPSTPWRGAAAKSISRRDAIRLRPSPTPARPPARPGCVRRGRFTPSPRATIWSAARGIVGYYYHYFLTPVLNSQGMKKLRYAIQKSTKIKLE